MSRFAWLLGGLLAASLIIPTTVEASAIAHESRTLAGVSAHIITVDLNRPEVKISVDVARGGFPNADAPFSKFIERTRPTAAINGTFFDKHALKPIGDIVIEGRLGRGRWPTCSSFSSASSQT